MKNTTEKVEYILRIHSEARADDRELYKYFLVYTQYKTMSENLIDVNIISKCPSMDTLSRIRRKLNENGLYLPPTNIKQMRKARSEKMRKEFKK